MHDIEVSINEYCEKNLPREPAWIAALNRRFHGIASRLDITKSVQREIADHLRCAYESHLERGQSPENAWRQAQDRFGDISLIVEEIRQTRAQSYRCLLIRILAIIALIVLPLGKIAQVRFPAFFQPTLLCLIAFCAVVGALVTHKRDVASLRKYALYGSWTALAWGIIRIFTINNDPSKMGSLIAVILLATFYGLFLAAPAARGISPAIMMGLCHVGVLASLARIGMLNFSFAVINLPLLKMIAAFSITSILVVLIFFDIRKVHLRLAGGASFAMVFAYINILSSLTQLYATIPMLLLATSLPLLITVLSIMPIQKLRDRFLSEAN
jgi:hypothetical protein